MPSKVAFADHKCLAVGKSFSENAPRGAQSRLTETTRNLSTLVGKLYFASIRLAFALVCVGASVILGGHWLGLVPDVAEATMRARQTKSEAIAINAAAHVRKSQWIDLKTTLQTQVLRDDSLLSVGVRSDTGTLRVDTGDHAEIWQAIEESSSDVDAVMVPITLNRRPWGVVELCYEPQGPTLLGGIFGNPLFRMLAFFFAAGIVAYTIFVVKVLKLFNNTQVVPERVRQALDTLAEGLLVLDERERIVLANRAFAEALDTDVDDLIDTRASDLPWIFPEEQADRRYPWAIAIDESTNQMEQMLRYTLDSGKDRIFSVNAAPLGNERVQRGSLATFRDVTHIEEYRTALESMLAKLQSSRDEIERKNAELEILATQDALTGCLNRRAFFDRFGKLWKEAKETGKPLSCIMIDNDHFKSVNDNYGHHVGDEVLRQVAGVIRERHGEDGLVCRYGGEEFCVVIPNCSLERGIEEAELTRIAISDIRLESPQDLRLSASIGVSETRFEPAEPQDIINQADLCLYTAKRNGRNQVVPFEPSMLDQDFSEGSEEAPDRADIPFRAVTALMSVLSYRDLNTAEHSRRVADLCVRVAEDIFTQHETFVLEVAAMLHDIGKVGVPDHILLKPGPLTKAEWQVMSHHDRIGVEIIAGAFECQLLTDIIASHHQFYGRGPDGDTIDERGVPQAARLLAICDTYDAIVSDRVYRKGRTHDEAIAELRRCAGTQFDPELVEQFAAKITERTASIDNSSSTSQAALQIGYKVERIAQAIESQNKNKMRSLATELGSYARNCEIDAIALAADKFEKHVETDDIQWLKLLRDAHDLLDICRATQSKILLASLASDRARIEFNNHMDSR